MERFKSLYCWRLNICVFSAGWPPSSQSCINCSWGRLSPYRHCSSRARSVSPLCPPSPLSRSSVTVSVHKRQQINWCFLICTVFILLLVTSSHVHFCPDTTCFCCCVCGYPFVSCLVLRQCLLVCCIVTYFSFASQTRLSSMISVWSEMRASMGPWISSLQDTPPRLWSHSFLVRTHYFHFGRIRDR